jgi:xanthine dehydrogenase iron-sulfur cluster and FAD-binding subunit A
VGLWVTKGLKSLGDIVYVGAAVDLGHIDVVEQDGAASRPTRTLRIGAAVSLEQPACTKGQIEVATSLRRVICTKPLRCLTLSPLRRPD